MLPPSPAIAAVVVAAGSGVRAARGMPKQFAMWRGKPVVRHSVEAFVKAGCAPIVVVIPAGCEAEAGAALVGLTGVTCVPGGATRQESVRNGLEALATAAPAHVLIHDAARPILPAAVIARLIDALAQHQAAIPVLPVPDSLGYAEEAAIGDLAPREDLRRIQTPQAFHFPAILAAHRSWKEASDAPDDAQVARAAGMTVAMVEGDEALSKLTYASDFAVQPSPIRTGSGYDVHRLVAGEELWLCGLRIEHTHGLAGHSDADVAIHALVDALLGAIGAGDIGQHFPPGDPQWRGAASSQFLSHAAALVAQAGYRVGNVDLTLICEAPKIGPYRDAMRARLAELIGVDIGAVSVKATTTEGLGFTGRGEGIAAQAVATLVQF